jgi:hypothetical protein
MLEPLIKLNNEVDAGELDRWLDLSQTPVQMPVEYWADNFVEQH